MDKALIGGLFTVGIFALNELFSFLRKRSSKKQNFLEYLLPKRIEAHIDITKRFLDIGYSRTQNEGESFLDFNIYDLVTDTVIVCTELMDKYSIIMSSNVYLELSDIYLICMGNRIDFNNSEYKLSLDRSIEMKSELDLAYLRLRNCCREDIGGVALDQAVANLRGTRY